MYGALVKGTHVFGRPWLGLNTTQVLVRNCWNSQPPPTGAAKNLPFDSTVLYCSQERVRDVGGHAVEAGRAAVVHPGPALARGGVRRAPRPPAQTHGGRHDRGCRQEVRRLSWKSADFNLAQPPPTIKRLHNLMMTSYRKVQNPFNLMTSENRREAKAPKQLWTCLGVSCFCH